MSMCILLHIMNRFLCVVIIHIFVIKTVYILSNIHLTHNIKLYRYQNLGVGTSAMDVQIIRS